MNAILFTFGLTVYAAAQLGAGSKALSVTFGWHPVIGSAVGAAVILLYSFAGGLQASIWTDVLQSFIMIGAMFLLLIVTMESLGGFEATLAALQKVQAGYLNLFPSTWQENGTGNLGFIVGWLFGGIGVIGQPHIMIRYLALDNVRSLNRMRLYYYTWFTLFYAATIGVGLLARVIIPETEGFDAETALLVLADKTLPSFLIGVILAGLFAATISTADSLVLSCSASLTRDFTRRPLETFRVAKLGTLVVTTAALGIALLNDKSVFALVLDAWGVFASALGPLIFLLATGYRIPEKMPLCCC